jgi:PRTRC genetic system protein E
MFQQLEALVRASGKLQLVIKMDGDKMAVVVVPQGDSKEGALRQPLVLTSTAAELDEGFAAAIASYSSAHASLSEQVAVTTAILQEAEKGQVSKAQKSLAKGGKTSTSPAAAAAGGEDRDEDEDDGGESSEASASTSTPASAPAADKPAGTDLFALLS